MDIAYDRVNIDPSHSDRRNEKYNENDIRCSIVAVNHCRMTFARIIIIVVYFYGRTGFKILEYFGGFVHGSYKILFIRIFAHVKGNFKDIVDNIIIISTERIGGFIAYFRLGLCCLLQKFPVFLI